MHRSITMIILLLLVFVLSIGFKRAEVTKADYSCVTLRSNALNAQPKPRNAFIPQCTIYGNYLKQQCNPQTNTCWCVDRAGNTISGTLVLDARPSSCKLNWIERWYQHLQT